MLFDSNNFIQYYFFVCIHLTVFKYCYLLFAQSQVVSSIAIYCFHRVKWFQVLLFIVCTESSGFKYCNVELKIHNPMIPSVTM